MEKIHQRAVEFILNDDWNSAHRFIQEYSDPFSCHIHGYLHLVEGDKANAGYWYHRAGLATPEGSVAEELQRLTAILSKNLTKAD